MAVAECDAVFEEVSLFGLPGCLSALCFHLIMSSIRERKSPIVSRKGTARKTRPLFF